MSGHFKPILLGALVAPLPMALALTAASLAVGGLSIVTAIWVVIAYFFVWVLLSISRIVLRLASWTSLRAHLFAMFIVTFLPMLSVYKFYEFGPDASVYYEINDGGLQVIEFSVAGVLIALIAALLNVACMAIYWRIVNPANRSMP